MRSLASMTALALLASIPAFAQKMDNADAAAMKQLAQDNLNEIAAAKSAASKAQSPEVKNYASKMAQDHEQMLQELRTLAKSKDVALPDSASVKDMAQMKMAERKSGAEFDKHYMEQMVKDHQKDAKETQDLAAKAKDPDFRSAMQKAHAKVEEHLRLAQQIAGRTGAAGGTSK
jgi:putative membrane protein